MVNNQSKIFLDVPDDIDETWTHVALIGGMVDRAKDEYSLAKYFKQAGDILIQQGLGLGHAEAYELLYPVLHNYRHAIELYLKAIVKPSKRNHDLASLMEQFKKLLNDHHGTGVPTWFEHTIREFIDVDPTSTTFRYAEGTPLPEEHIVNFPELQKIMDVLADSFHRVFLAEKSFTQK
jgi:hypothetical protein